MNSKQKLLDRINAVINTRAFELTLNNNGLDVMDFQSEWPSYDSFEALPTVFAEAILAGEEELDRHEIAPMD